jgi:alpha-glucosidase
MYYGDELGIGKVKIPKDEIQDPWERNEPGLGLSRDPSRTPFQWDATPNAGFSLAKPWLPVDPSYGSCNAENLRDDAASILNLYRTLLSIRRKHVALHSGAYRLIGVQGTALLYERIAGLERIVVCLNFGSTDQPISPQKGDKSSILASTHFDRTAVASDLVLRPNEGLTVLTEN